MLRFFQNLFPVLLPLAAAAVPHPVMAGSVPTMYVALLGDFLPGASASEVIRDRGYGHLFDGIRGRTGGVDTLFLNLETPLSTRGRAVEEKKYTFRAPPEVASALRREKVLAVTLGNNHILDYGVQALRDTFAHLKEAGVAYTGAGSDWQDATRAAVVSTPVGDIRFVAFSNTLPKRYWAGKDKTGTLYGSEKAVSIAVSRHRGSGPVVAAFHWGAELMAEPKEYQEDLARLAVDSGATLVVGHHPHVPQPIEVYEGVPVLYSLGNFAFGSWSDRTPYGLMAVAEFEEGGRCTVLEVYPLNTDNSRVVFSPRPVTGPEGRKVFEDLTRGIGPAEATVSWDGEKGVIVPIRAGD